jgi:hypothetical protein
VQRNDVGAELRRRNIRDEVLRRAKLCGAHVLVATIGSCRDGPSVLRSA